MKLPTKKRLRELADKLWSAAVKEDWGNRCAVCRVSAPLESHHLIRRSRSTVHRYSIRNGIALCTSHHNFNPQCSPHNGDVGFNDWLRREHPRVVRWVLDHQYESMDGKTTSKGWYVDRMVELSDNVDPDLLRDCVGVNLSKLIIERAKNDESAASSV